MTALKWFEFAAQQICCRKHVSWSGVTQESGIWGSANSIQHGIQRGAYERLQAAGVFVSAAKMAVYDAVDNC